jgi:hypothetical protein
MQRNKVTKNNSELEIVTKNSEMLTSSLTDVMNKFEVKRNLQVFDFLKCKGLAILSLLNILLILPFYGMANVNQLMKCGISKTDFEGKKTSFYNTKNNEFIDWRKLLMLHVKRFIYLINNNINLKSTKLTAIIFDDTLLEKAGKKIEKIGYVHDHVSGRFILGYKLLVCGFWDGESFIPVDFTLHREKGTAHVKATNEYHQLCKSLDKQKHELSVLNAKIEKCNEKLAAAQAKYVAKPFKVNAINIERILVKQLALQNQKEEIECEITKKTVQKTQAHKSLKRSYLSNKLFGLTAKERQEQFRKAVSTKSHGFTRRKEADKSKIDCMLAMLSRVVKAGIIPNYVLVDSWFFCLELLEKLSNLKKGMIKLVSMIKINNQKFTIGQSNKELPIKVILKNNERKAHTCKKFKAQYICVKCWYKGIRINLFFVKIGKSSKWHLLATTDLDLNFIKLMEIYQIRWSIEIFFKESKQYLYLSACSSNTFDAQIADISIAMVQSIMLSYFKRINYQQSIGGLFTTISKELVELDLISRLLIFFQEILEEMCLTKGIDFIELQDDMMKNEKIMEKFQKLLPDKPLSKAA